MVEVEATAALEDLVEIPVAIALYFVEDLKTLVLLVDLVGVFPEAQLALAAAHPELVGQRHLQL
jgi:hypothetical protein